MPEWLTADAARQLVVLGGGLAAVFGYGQLLWYRQQQSITEARALKAATTIEREKAEGEAEAARQARRAAEHERRNAEQIAAGARLQLDDTERQLISCRESESRLRSDVAGYRADIDTLRDQVGELRRILRVRFEDQPRRQADPPNAEHERDL